ncbi:MAG: nodulation protein NfeD [Chloroflexi bacterium]|nr:nodulation protein NfeD [Chloroflexota bacterium]
MWGGLSMDTRVRLLFCSVLLASGLTLAGPARAQDAGPLVVSGQVNGIINPLSAGYVERLIDEGERRGASAVVLRLNTPGGLDTSMRQIISRILSSNVPVITYVSPAGGRAASAGVYITYASHIAAMHPNTNIGSATPVALGENGEAQMSDEMKGKVQNDAVAYIKSLAAQRGRNAEWAEQAIRQQANVTASDALSAHVVDIVAPDLASLLSQADGRTVQTGAGPVVLHTAQARVEAVDMNPVERLLHAVTDPTIAYILLSLGSLGLMLELYNPGQVIPGIVGVICLLLAFYALGTLPVNYAGLLLLLFGVVLFVLEAYTPSHGALTVGGGAAFLAGSLLLFNAPDAPYLQVSIAAIAAVTAVLVTFGFVVVGLAVGTRHRRVTTGREGLLGQVAEVRRALDPEGMVHVEGELWQAVTEGRRVEVGERVRILAVDGLRLSVTPESPRPGVRAARPAEPTAVEAVPATQQPRPTAAAG